MLIKLRKGKRAQSLVIVALSATALFGIIALGLDAGRLYFQRRDVQNAADAGALAGAQELLPTGSNTTVTSAMIDSAGCQASVYALLGLLDTPRDGSGICQPSPDQGRLVSNSKWHAPNPGGDWMNLNGQFYYSQASDTHALIEYWYKSVGTSQPIEGSPNYEPPLKPGFALPPTTTTYNGKTVHVYYPGTYINPINATNNNDYYRFMNGIYYFQDVDFNITGGIVSNTSDGVPHYGPYGGVSDLPAAADRTNGVTFVFDGNAKFPASPSGHTSPRVLFAAPSFISDGT